MVRIFSLGGELLDTLPQERYATVGDVAHAVALLLKAPRCSRLKLRGSSRSLLGAFIDSFRLVSKRFRYTPESIEA